MDLVAESKAPRVLVAQQGRPGRRRSAAAAAARDYEKDGFADIVPMSAKTGENVDRLEQVLLVAPAGRRAALSGGLPDRSARAILRRRTGPRAGAAADARRAAVLDRRRRRQVRGAGRQGPDAPLLHDPRRARIAEADHRRQGRGDDQGDRHRRAQGARSGFSTPGCFSICTSRCARAGAKTNACSTRSDCRRRTAAERPSNALSSALSAPFAC